MTAIPRAKLPGRQLFLGLCPLFQFPRSTRRPRRGSRATWAKQEQTLLTESETALTAGKSVKRRGGEQESGHHHEVQAPDRVDAQGVL